MKRFFLLLVILGAGISVYAQHQTQQESALQKQFGFEVNLVSPGFGVSYELPISKRFLLDFAGGFGMPMHKREGSLVINSGEINPYTRFELKYYYNRDRRLRKGKEINNNRGNFIGAQSKLMFGLTHDDATIALNEIHWGVQTEIAKKLLLTFQIGAAHYYTRDRYHFYSLLLDFKVKYIF